MTDLSTPSLRTGACPADPDDAFPDQSSAEPVQAEPHPAAGRRPRPGLLVVAGVAVLLVLAVVAWQVVVRTYGLVPGSYGGGGPGSRPFESALADGVEYGYTPDGTYELYFSVRNPGPLPVRVEAADRPALRLVRLDVVAPAEPCCDPSTAVPFQPVELAAGAELVLRATFRVGRIFHDLELDSCSSVWWSTIQVRYTVLGVARVGEVDLPEALSLRAPGCPD